MSTALVKTNNLIGYVQKTKEQISVALPKHIKSDWYIRQILTLIRQNPRLAECDVMTVLGSIMKAAQLGLTPGLNGQCYILPYGNNAQFQMGYQGLLELLYRTGKIANVTAEKVTKQELENFTYEMEDGIKKIKHKIQLTGRRNDAVGYYVSISFVDPNIPPVYYYMSTEDIEYHRNTYAKSRNVWDKNFDAMAKKTVFLQAIKFLPKSTELQETSVDKVYKYDENTGEVEGESNEEAYADNNIIDSTYEQVEDDDGL